MRPITLTPIRLWIGLMMLLTAGCLGAYVVMQQGERLGANDPQVQLAEDAAAALEHGRTAAQVVGSDTVDVARSLAPFVVVLDDTDAPLASSGQLDGRTPVPPRGMLAAVRATGEERLTWAPRPGVRLASVARRVRGPRPSVVVAARSLREAERRITTIGHLIVFGWCISAIGLAIAVVLVARFLPAPAR